MEDDEREQLIKIRSYSEQTFDKQLVYLAGGGLVLTIGFIKEIIDLSTSTYNPLLYISWIGLCLCLLFNLLSHKSSSRAIDEYLKDKHNKGDQWNSITSNMNTTSIVFLITGISTFILFILFNINV